MKAIKIPDTIDDKDWAPVWRVLIEMGGLTRISLTDTENSNDRVYLVQDQQLEILKQKSFPFEEIDISKIKIKGQKFAAGR
jgi:hypothetical protein